MDVVKRGAKVSVGRKKPICAANGSEEVSQQNHTESGINFCAEREVIFPCPLYVAVYSVLFADEGSQQLFKGSFHFKIHSIQNTGGLTAPCILVADVVIQTVFVLGAD